jgi:hypothetical protein
LFLCQLHDKHVDSEGVVLIVSSDCRTCCKTLHRLPFGYHSFDKTYYFS